MPIYEYECKVCKQVKEKLQRVSDPPPHCECSPEEPMRKKVSTSNFQLRGGGWYRDGYVS